MFDITQSIKCAIEEEYTANMGSWGILQQNLNLESDSIKTKTTLKLLYNVKLIDGYD